MPRAKRGQQLPHSCSSQHRQLACLSCLRLVVPVFLFATKPEGKLLGSLFRFQLIRTTEDTGNTGRLKGGRLLKRTRRPHPQKAVSLVTPANHMVDLSRQTPASASAPSRDFSSPRPYKRWSVFYRTDPIKGGTNFSVAYLAVLAVDVAYHRQGIVKRLINERNERSDVNVWSFYWLHRKLNEDLRGWF